MVSSPRYSRLEGMVVAQSTTSRSTTARPMSVEAPKRLGGGPSAPLAASPSRRLLALWASFSLIYAKYTLIILSARRYPGLCFMTLASIHPFVHCSSPNPIVASDAASYGEEVVESERSSADEIM